MIEKEMKEIWEKELKDKITEKVNSMMAEKYIEYEKLFNKFTNEANKKIEKIDKMYEFEVLKRKMKLQNLLNIKNSNSLINHILICLINIEPIINLYLGPEKDEIKQKIDEFEKNNFFSFFLNLINNLWIVSKDYYPVEIHNKLKELLKNEYNSNNPGFIISSVLSKINEELKYSKDNKIKGNLKKSTLQKYNTDLFKKRQNIISRNIFVTHRIRKKCQNCEGEEFYYEQKPIINLFIQEEDKIKEVKKGYFKDVSLKNYFLFLLNDKIEVNENCSFCNKKIQTNNFIEILNNNIFIVYVDRDKDKNYTRDFIYEKKMKFKDFNNIEYTLISVLIMKINKIENNKQNIKNKNVIINDVDMSDQNFTYFINFSDNKWYLYNNGKIKRLENENEIINKKYAHLLIYKKV